MQNIVPHACAYVGTPNPYRVPAHSVRSGIGMGLMKTGETNA